MPNISFSHPAIPNPLWISVNPDQVTWAYGLNTQSYPTYGGEVVQILSVYFDDITITGTVSTYAELENIYTWFIAYMQIATQGRDQPNYDQHPVKFIYYERQWEFSIWPKSLPGFTYGRDVVAPTWTVVAAVKEPDPVFSAQLISTAAYNATVTGTLAPFGKATADFGNTGDLTNNPWASPDGAAAFEGMTMAQYLSKDDGTLVDEFSAFVKGFNNTPLDIPALFPNVSKAATPVIPGVAANPSPKKGKVKKK